MKNKQKSIAIIGHFGGDENFLDGQTIKTKSLYEELDKKQKWKIQKVDTYYKNKKPISLLFDLVYAIFTAKDIFILVAENGMKFFFPILYFCSKALRKNIYHFIIGGSLDRRVKKYKNFKKYINSFTVNWCETVGLVERLEVLGITNAELLYNFKDLIRLKDEDLIYHTEEPYKLCTFSRVMKEKGIEDAVKAVKTVNEQFGRTVYTLDIYGQIDGEQTQWFEDFQKNFPSYARYKGEVDFEKSVEVLKNYFALLFPTRYYTEGVPGTVIDAYAAGLPVIASKWENFDNMIDETTGFSYAFGEVNDLEELLFEIADNPELVFSKKRNCLEKYKLFTPEIIIETIEQKMQQTAN